MTVRTITAPRKGEVEDPNERRTWLSSQNGIRSREAHGSDDSQGSGAFVERALGRASNPTMTRPSSMGKSKRPGVSSGRRDWGDFPKSHPCATQSASPSRQQVTRIARTREGMTREV